MEGTQTLRKVLFLFFFFFFTLTVLITQIDEVSWSWESQNRMPSQIECEFKEKLKPYHGISNTKKKRCYGNEEYILLSPVALNNILKIESQL